MDDALKTTHRLPAVYRVRTWGQEFSWQHEGAAVLRNGIVIGSCDWLDGVERCARQAIADAREHVAIAVGHDWMLDQYTVELESVQYCAFGGLLAKGTLVGWGGQLSVYVLDGQVRSIEPRLHAEALRDHHRSLVNAISAHVREELAAAAEEE